MTITADQAVEAASRAATAAGQCGEKGWFGEAGLGRDPSEAAKAVRSGLLSGAPALFASLSDGADVRRWGDLEPRLRVAIEVFRASLIALDRIVAEDGKQ